MKDDGRAHKPSKASGIQPHRDQGLRGAPHEQPIDEVGLLSRQRSELRRQGEDDMEVVGIQEALLLSLDPSVLGATLALWAMPIAA